MKSYAWLGSFLLLGTAAVAGPADYVVRLVMPTDEGVAWASAVLVADGVALTAEHCRITDGSYVSIPQGVHVLRDPEKNGIDEAQLIGVSQSCIEPLQIGPTPVSGDAVTAYGYPNGKFQGYSGRVSVVTQTDIICDFLIDHGASGGGLFNQQGQLIGIASAKDPVNGRSLWIHTDSIRAAMEGITPAQGMDSLEQGLDQAPGKFQRKRRVVVLSMTGCGPCERLKRDIAMGKFPGFEFEIATFDTSLGTWDKPDLHASFLNECKPRRDPLAPTIWIPGTGKYREGYDSTPGLLGWIESVIKLVFVGPPSRLPHGIFTAPEAGEQDSLVTDLLSLRGQVAKLKSDLETFKEGGVITKIKGVAVLKEDKADIEASIESLREKVSGVKEDPLSSLLSILAGLVTGVVHSWLPLPLRKGVA